MLTLRNALGIVLCRQGFYDRAIALLEEALAIMTMLDDRQSLGLVLGTFAGVLADRGEQIERALLFFEQARALAQAFNQPLREANVLSPMGNLLTLTGNYARIRSLIRSIAASTASPSNSWRCMDNAIPGHACVCAGRLRTRSLAFPRKPDHCGGVQ